MQNHTEKWQMPNPIDIVAGNSTPNERQFAQMQKLQNNKSNQPPKQDTTEGNK